MTDHSTIWDSQDPEDIWDELNIRYGPPVYIASWAHKERLPAVSRGEVMWILQNSDGYGSGDVTFRLALPGDNFSPAFDHLHLLQAVTFGVPLDPLWIEVLNRNTWDRLSDSRYFRAGGRGR